MIAHQNFSGTFITYVLGFFILRLRLRPTAKGRSLSGPNIRLRPKVKIAPMVQHCKFFLQKILGNTQVQSQKMVILHSILYWPLYLFLAGCKKSHYCRDQICLNDSGNLHSLHLGSIFQDFLGHWSCHTNEYGNRAYWRPSVSNSSGYERSKVSPFVEL